MFDRIVQQRTMQTYATTSQGGGIFLPLHWTPMGKELVIRVKLDTSSGLMKAEFDNVEKNFRRTMTQSKIIQIERVQNRFAWEHYSL